MSSLVALRRPRLPMVSPTFESRVLTTDSTKGLTVTRTNVEEVVEMLSGAESVIIVPGYGVTPFQIWQFVTFADTVPSGMAVAKAQYAISDMIQSLKAKGVNCRFGIHPVAGRMPGQVRSLVRIGALTADIFDVVQCASRRGRRAV